MKYILYFICFSTWCFFVQKCDDYNMNSHFYEFVEINEVVSIHYKYRHSEYYLYDVKLSKDIQLGDVYLVYDHSYYCDKDTTLYSLYESFLKSNNDILNYQDFLVYQEDNYLQSNDIYYGLDDVLMISFNIKGKGVKFKKKCRGFIGSTPKDALTCDFGKTKLKLPHIALLSIDTCYSLSSAQIKELNLTKYEYKGFYEVTCD